MVTKKLWQMAVCAVLLLVVAACGKEDEDNIIWDIANFKIEIKVSNQQGQDITSQVASMAPEAVWKGKTYALKTKRTETNMSARTRRTSSSLAMNWCGKTTNPSSTSPSSSTENQ